MASPCLDAGPGAGIGRRAPPRTSSAVKLEHRAGGEGRRQEAHRPLPRRGAKRLQRGAPTIMVGRAMAQAPFGPGRGGADGNVVLGANVQWRTAIAAIVRRDVGPAAATCVAAVTRVGYHAQGAAAPTTRKAVAHRAPATWGATARTSRNSTASLGLQANGLEGVSLGSEGGVRT